MNESYSVVKSKLGNLTRFQTNAYTELSVVNFTTDPFVMIDNNNEQTIIPPVQTSGIHENVISIFKRTGVGSTLGSNGEQMSMEGLTIKIEKCQFRNGPVFVSEINRLICTEEQALTAVHPFSQISYEDSMQSALDNMAATIDDAPAFRLVANDPTHSYEKLWTIMDNEVVGVPVMHEPGETMVLTVITMRDGSIYKEDMDLSTILSGKDNTVKFINRLIPWVTSSELKARDLAKTFTWITPEYLEEYKTSVNAESKRTLDQNKAAMEAKISDINTRLINTEALLSRAEAERDDYKYRYTNGRADEQTRLDQLKNMYAMMQMRNDFGISNNNLQMAGWKMQSAQQESQFKIWHLALAAGLPILGLMAMKMFEGAFKNK